MTLREIVRQGLYYARTCRSLWLFGFFVGIGGSSPVTYTVRSGAGGDGDAGGAAAGALLDLSVAEVTLIAIVIVLAVAAVVVMRFVGEGALIVGVVRTRQGGTMTAREGFHSGWAHWGVLVRIALLYLVATLGSVGLLAVPCVIALQALGPPGGVLLGIPTLFIGVPWLVTLYIVQAFAWPIAVLENRDAFDAIGKARLFLHGRLIHGPWLIRAA